MADISNDKTPSFSIVGVAIKLLDSLRKSYDQRRENNLREDLKKQESKIINRFVKEAGLTKDILDKYPEAMEGIYESDEFTKAFDKLHSSDKYAKLFHKEQNTVDKIEDKVWITDKHDEDSKILSYTASNGEKAFFLIRSGNFDGGDIGLNCLSNNPMQMKENEKIYLNPDYAYTDDKKQFTDGLDEFKTVKRLVGDTIKRLDKMQADGQSISFADIKKHLDHRFIEYFVYNDDEKEIDLARNSEASPLFLSKDYEQKQSQQADQPQPTPQPCIKPSEIEAAKKAGYVQGVCECVAAVGNDYALGKKLLTEMNVTKKLAKEYASPETFKALESGIFAQKQEQKLEHQQKRGHRR
jgi:hypothetical protein